MSISIVRSALICERPRGAGRGQKICGNCRKINNTSVRACNGCGGKFLDGDAPKKGRPTFAQVALRNNPALATIIHPEMSCKAFRIAMATVPNNLKIVRTEKKPSKRVILNRIAKLQNQLNQAIAELTSL